MFGQLVRVPPDLGRVRVTAVARAPSIDSPDRRPSTRMSTSSKSHPRSFCANELATGDSPEGTTRNARADGAGLAAQDRVDDRHDREEMPMTNELAIGDSLEANELAAALGLRAERA